MAALYAPEATFEDPVFRLRGGANVGKMWIALTRRAKRFEVSYTIVEAGPGSGRVELTARYLFGGKRPVVNAIVSEIALERGKIVRQVDRFDFPRWSAQALGLPGRLFGSFDWFRRLFARRAMRAMGLERIEDLGSGI